MTTRCQTPSRNLHPQRLLLAGVTLALAYATLPASAQTGAPQATQQLRAVPPAPRQPNYVMLDAKPVADSEEPSEATPSDANHVGLKLHGHWVVDVLNPDHSLAQHHVFENSLNPLSGASIILGLLSGYISAGNQAIQLSGSPTPCFSSNYQGNGTYYCEMVTSTAVFPGKADCTSPSNTYGYSYCAATLSATYNPDFTGGYGTPSLVLTGNITANQAGSITQVGTEWNICSAFTGTNSTPSDLSPAACETNTNYYSLNQLTSTSPSPIAVASGQIIQVTITFTVS